MKKALYAICVMLLSAGFLSAETKLKEYKAVSGISGTVNSIGSDTLNNMMTLWAESFKRKYPNVTIQIEGKGSSTAPPALIQGISQLGPMSREMKSKEVDAFEKKFGYKPVKVGVAIDALAVFVHKDNTIAGMSLKDVDSAFSSTYSRGGKDAKVWGDLGLDGSWKDKAIALYGRNSASGTYGFFQKVALNKGSYKTSVKQQPGSAAVVNSVANDLGGIGYSGIGYKTSGVRALPLSVEGTSYNEPTLENCLNKSYPLARVLYIYVNKKPGQEIDKLTREFLTFALSVEGQAIVAKDGYYPLTGGAADMFLKALK
ncbi:MAG: PstS family phosphate ABC transporter substrate-binding protein [Lentisphaeraceae bacterium]|nr:PstS family phosphate ABC transporter substrate-binding protein [Lentisphaeraceae bacterium]